LTLSKTRKKRETTESLPRAAPRKTDIRDNRRLYRETRKGPKSRRVPLGELQANFQPQLSTCTIQRHLKEQTISKWLAKDRPQLKPEHKKARYQWALEHRNWKTEDWKKVLWSDECLVKRRCGKGPVWVFCTPQEKWHQDCIEPRGDLKKDTKVMFWGCFGGMGMMGLTDLPGDLESKRGVTGRIILEYALKKILPQILDNNPEFIFIQDGAKTHKAKRLVAWLEEKGYEKMVWPPYSPDLNPIEHVWAELKKLAYKLHPELYSVTGPDNVIKEKIKSAVYEAREHISDDFLYSLVESMEERVTAVRLAKGGYMRY
jgi:transposase